MQKCWMCKEDASDGFTVGILVASMGSGPQRIKKYATLAKICRKCGKSPGGRRTRHQLNAALRSMVADLCGHIEKELEVLTREKDNQQGT